MIELVNLSDKSETQVSLQDFLNTKLVNVWIGVTDPSHEELKAIADKTGITADFLQLPKIENYINLRLEPEYGIVNFLIVGDIFTGKIFHQVVLAFSKDNLITVVREEDRSKVNLAKEHLINGDPPSLAVCYILEEIVSEHFVQLGRLEESTVNLERDALEKADEDTLKRVFSLKGRLRSFSIILRDERGLLFELNNYKARWFSRETKSHLETVNEYLTRQINIIETYREIMSDAVSAYLSAVNNRINVSIRSLTLVMFYLTIISTLTSFPNTIATFFGIHQFGDTNNIIIFVALAVSIILPFIWLRKRKWLELK